jgi:hypothetical protein
VEELLGANQLLEMNHETSHGVAEDNSPWRQPWEPDEKAISPGRGDRNLLSNRVFFRRYAARNLQLKPTADAVGCSLSLLRSYWTPLSRLLLRPKGLSCATPAFRAILRS